MLSILKPFVRLLLFIGKLNEIASGIEFALVTIGFELLFLQIATHLNHFQDLIDHSPFKNSESAIKFVSLLGSVIVNS